MKNKNILYLILIVLLALALRLLVLMNQGSLWFDEVFTVHFAKYNPLKIISYIIHDNNPPLHFLYVHYWIKIFGDTDLIVRLSSLIVGLANVLVIYLVGKKIFSKKVGLISAFFSAISLFHIYVSIEARMYGLLLLLSLLSFYFFVSLLEKFSNNNIFFYIFFTILALLTHFTGLFLLFIHTFFVVFLKIKKETKIGVKAWIFIQTIIILIFALWFGPMIYFKLDDVSNISQSWYVNMETDNFFIESINDFFVYGKFILLNNLFLQILIWVLLSAAFVIVKGKEKSIELFFSFSNKIILLLFWLFFPLAVGACFHLYVPKYYIISSPALFILIARGIDCISKSKRITLIILSIIFVLVFPVINSLPYSNYRWDEVAKYFEEKTFPKTKIIASPFLLGFPLNYYYKGSLPVEGFYPINDDDDFDMRVVKKNWHSVTTNDNVKALKNSTDDYDRIFFLTRFLNIWQSDDYVRKWFFKNDWRLVGEKLFFDAYGVMEFERINKVPSD